jgi:hypothetical protein
MDNRPIAPAPDGLDAEAALLWQLGLLTEKHLAVIAGVEVKTVKEWRAERRGPPFTRLGRRPLYRVEAFQEWLRDREEETQP